MTINKYSIKLFIRHKFERRVYYLFQSFIFLQQANAIVRSIQKIERKVNKGLLKYCAYICPIQLLQKLKWE